MPKSGKLKIDTTGPDGNAFVLMAYVRMLSKHLKINHEPILDEMMSGDYEHLIQVMEKHFGDHIILYR